MGGNGTLTNIKVTGDGNALLDTLPGDQVSEHGGFTIDPTQHAAKGYNAITTTISSYSNIRLRAIIDGSDWGMVNCAFKVDESLPRVMVYGVSPKRILIPIPHLS